MPTKQAATKRAPASKATTAKKASSPKNVARSKTAASSGGLAGALRDLRSDAFRSLLASASAEEVDALLEGVAWERGKYAASLGTLRGNALLTGRGATARPMVSRLLEVVAIAPGEIAARARRDATSLSFDAASGTPFDVGPLAAFTALEQVEVRDAARLEGLAGLAHVKKVVLWRIGELDLAALPGPTGGHVTCFDAKRVTGLEAPGRSGVSVLPLPVDTVLTSFGARTVVIGAAPAQEQIGPIAGRGGSLEVTGPVDRNALARVELGAWPNLEMLDVGALRTLREIHGLEGLASLVSLVLVGAFDVLPTLPSSLRILKVVAPLSDVRALASLVSLTSLRLHLTSPVRDVPGLEAIASMRDLGTLELAGHAPLGVLDQLPVMPYLRAMTLSSMDLERVPDLARFAPELEVVSLTNTHGFLEHDTLCRLPKLKTLYVGGSTLARHRNQIDPRLARAGVEIL